MIHIISLVMEKNYGGRPKNSENIIINTPEVQSIDINGTQLHYVELGRQNKQSVIFVHGALSDYRLWQFQVEPFAQRYRVISYSRRGAFPNELQKDFHYTEGNDAVKQGASDLTELIRKLDLAPVHMVGISDGAFAALFLACQNPDQFRTLVFAEPAALPVLAASNREDDDLKLIQNLWDGAFKPAKEAFDQGQFEKGVRIIGDAVMAKGFFDQLPPHVKQSILQNVGEFHKQLEAEMPKEFPLQQLENISSKPVLFVNGEQSPKFLIRIIEILASKLPKSERLVIPGVTHELGLSSKPDVFNSYVLAFLAKH